MATFGKTTVGAYSVTYNTGTKRGSKFTLSEAGTVTAISVYATSVNGNIKFAIYSNGADNRPANKIWADDVGQVMVNGWNTKNGLNIPLQPGDYWLCWMISGSSVTFYYDAEPCRAWNAQAYTDPWPDSWGTSSYGTDRSHSIYCTYTPSGGQIYEINVDAVSQSLATPTPQCTFNIAKDAAVSSQSLHAPETTFSISQNAITQALATAVIEIVTGVIEIFKDAIATAQAISAYEITFTLPLNAIVKAEALSTLESILNISPSATVKVQAEVVTAKEGEIKITKLFLILGDLAIQIQGD